ncbi:MAG: hypothetical protein ABSA71_09180 [Desulfomonilia bacterium]|jgi:hypothetical protein
MATFDDFYKDLKGQIEELAESSFKTCKDEAIGDCNCFLQNLENDLDSWTKQLSTGELSQKDFIWLVNSKKPSITLESLTQQGLAQVDLDKLKNDLIDKVVTTALKYFLVAVLPV